MKRRDGGFLVILALAVGAFFMFARTLATNVAAAYEGKPELIAATFASSWCSACKILKPKLAKAIPAFAGEPVKFVEYDFTFGAQPETRDAAELDGLGALYDRYRGATGFTVLVDAETHEIIGMLTMDLTRKEIEAVIVRALAVAEAGS